MMMCVWGGYCGRDDRESDFWYALWGHGWLEIVYALGSRQWVADINDYHLDTTDIL